MKRAIGLLVGLLTASATTAFADDLGKDFEASMVVTGTITVNPDGSVNSYTLDQPDKLPPAATQVASATLPKWKFQPVLEDGKPVMAKSSMSVRIVAHPIDAQHATVSITGASFGRDASQRKDSPECESGECLIAKLRTLPPYPIEGLRNQLSGTVYLVQEIGRDGHVVRQAIKQVNLRSRWYASSAKMFADASLEVARDWTYSVPTSGDEAKRDHWIVSIPVDFTLGGTYAYGQWEPYIPGPVKIIPWATDDTNHVAANGSSDAIPDGGVPFIADSRFVLLTPFARDAAPGAP